MEATIVSDKDRSKAFRQNMEWFRAHYPELKKKHADEFVAINNQRVVDSDADSYKLIHRLRRQYGDLRSFAIEHVGDGKAELIL
jgi:hypothetical protein